MSEVLHCRCWAANTALGGTCGSHGVDLRTTVRVAEVLHMDDHLRCGPPRLQEDSGGGMGVKRQCRSL